jgi:predicted metal-dependent peptidase
MTQAMDRVKKARAKILYKNPFWGSLAMYLELVEDPTCETMWTDGSRLGFSPDFVASLPDDELMGCLAHEVSHCAYLHHTRRGHMDPSEYNKAADYSMNRDLIAGGFKFPKGVLVDPRFDGLYTEEIYAILMREKRQKQDQSQGGQSAGQSPASQGGQESQGGAAGNGNAANAAGGSLGSPSAAGEACKKQADPGGCGEIRDAAPAYDKPGLAQVESEWGVRVRQAIAASNAHFAGNLPGELARVFDQLKKPQVDWREQLRRFIDERSKTDYSWIRPNRRYLGMGLTLPGIVPDGINHIGMIVDTSMSMKDEVLSKIRAECQAALDEGSLQKITIVYCDTKVQRVDTFEAGQEIKFNPIGGGGTRFAPALDWFEKNEPNVSAIIYFTDLECTDYGEQPWVPTIWAAYGRSDKIAELAKKVPFGEVIHIRD